MTDRQQIAAQWADRGFSCDLWTDPPGQRWEDFTHATDELVTVLEGDMEFEVEGQVHHPGPGDELLIPAGAVHSKTQRKHRSTLTSSVVTRREPNSHAGSEHSSTETSSRGGMRLAILPQTGFPTLNLASFGLVPPEAQHHTLRRGRTANCVQRRSR
jgi:mannose-6-phosphate isomerase-like protein (cupin superfamily)